MEAHLRKITRCLGKAVGELEQVSTSEKAAGQVDAEWIARFHAGVTVPVPPDSDSFAEEKNDTHLASRNGEDGVGRTDLRWKFLESKWLPLLRDLHRTVSALDREERDIQKAENARISKEKEASSGSEDAASETAHRWVPGRRGSAPPPRPPKGLLSLRDYTVVHAALEIVVHWGMAPMLEPGLGSFDFDKRPRSRAVKISRRVLQYWKKTGQRPEFVGSSRLATKDSKPAPSSSAEGSVNSPSLGAGRARAQLALCVGAIQGVVTTEQFQPMLLPLYLPDLLAARLQLVYGRGAAVGPPLDERGCRRRDRSTAPAGTRGDGGTTLNLSPPSAMAGGSRAARQPMEEALQNLLRDLGPREIMGALRQLLSEGARAPSWLRHHGGRMLSEIVLRPGGVQATLEVYLAGAWAAGGGGSADGGGSGKWSEGDGLKACQRVAKLLATPPKRVLPGEYVSRVAPQLAEMLHYDGQQRALITSVVVMIVGRLSESMPRETRRLVLFPLLRPLLLFWGPGGERLPPTPIPATARIKGGDVEGDGAVASEEELGRCLEDLEKILTAAPAPPALLGLLSDAGVTVPLFRMHCFCNRSKSRDLQSTKACLAALLASCETAADDLVSALLPTKVGWGDSGAVFSAGSAGGTVLRVVGRGRGSNVRDFAAPMSGVDGQATMGTASRSDSGAEVESTLKRVGEGSDVGLGSERSAGSTSRYSTPAPRPNDSLLGLELSLQELGLNPETLELFRSASRLGVGDESPAGAELADTLTRLKEAEERAKDAAQILEGLGEGSPVAGKVFDRLLRRYLAVRDGKTSLSVSATKKNPGADGGADAEASRVAPSTDQSGRSALATTAPAASDAGEEHAVMAAVVVLAERLGALVFGTGAQVLSCIRLVLEHERPDVGEHGVRTDGGDVHGRRGEASEGCGVDAAARVAQMEAAAAAALHDVPSTTASGGMSLYPGLGAGENREDEMDDTLCSVVLGLLTTLLELGEESRPNEEEEELRAMLGPLKALAAGHPNAEVAEMSAMLCASILSRGLTPEQRREARERIKRVHGDCDDIEGVEKRTARMISALDAAEVDLRSEAVPMRARGVVTLTRLLRTSLEGGGGDGRSGGKGGSIARVDMNTVVLERLLDTYARMTVDADSYVYLAAVQGLAALADALPGWCIPRLVGLFVASAPAGAEDEAAPGTEVAAAGAQLSLSQRLKIGEAVVLSARRCGDAMPKYAHLFVNAFVVGARERSTRDRSGAGNRTSPGSLATRKKASCSEGTAHRAELKGQSIAATNVEQDGRGGVGRSLGPKEFDERAGGDIERDGTVDNGESLEMSLESRERYHFRASCLSNLAEVCQLLRWSLGKFSQDIVDLGVGVLRMETSSSEEAVLARRGAAFLLSRLLQGAGSDVLEIIPAEQLRAVYRALKNAAERDPDGATRSHARSALSYMDIAIRGQLFPNSGNGASIGSSRGDDDRVVDAARITTPGGEPPSPMHHPGITVL